MKASTATDMAMNNVLDPMLVSQLVGRLKICSGLLI